MKNLLKISILVVFLSSFTNILLCQDEIDEDLTGDEVVEFYLKSIGGKGKIKKLKDISMKLFIQVNNTGMEGYVYIKDFEKYYICCLIGEDTVQVHKYDGVQASYYDMEGEQKIRGKSLDELKYKSLFIPEIAYKKLGFEVEMTGIEKLNKRETYKLEIIKPNDRKQTDYIDGKTGLKLKTIETILTEDGRELEQTTLYRQYRFVGDVKIPFQKIIKTSADQIIIEIIGINVVRKLKDEIFEFPNKKKK